MLAKYRCVRQANFSGGINIILRQNVDEQVTKNIQMNLQDLSGELHRQSGILMMLRLIALQPHSKMRIMWQSLFIIIDGGLGSQKVSSNKMNTKNDLQKRRL